MPAWSAAIRSARAWRSNSISASTAIAKRRQARGPGQCQRLGQGARRAAGRTDGPVGELVIAQRASTRIALAINDANLKHHRGRVGAPVPGLRDTTMGIRMVPIGTIFGRFRRLIHDLSRDLNKEIEFVTTGEETELDKTVIIGWPIRWCT